MIKPILFSLPGEKQARLFKWSIYILGFVFFLNCFTPLRLHYDMLRYFAIKDCIESKCPPGADPNDYMPYGYTALLLLLSKLGILKSFYIVFVNCLYLFGGLYFVRKIFNYIRAPYFLFFLVLLNWTIIKFVTHPLSELQYLFFSLASLYAFYLFVLHKNIWNLLLAFLLAGLAFLTRTVGIALVAALFAALIWEYRKLLLDLVRKNWVLVLAFLLSVAVLLIFSRQLGLNHYTGVMSKQFKEGLRFSDVISWHFSEWGEILLNTSKFKVVGYLPGSLGIWLFAIIGILGICGFVYICFIKKNSIPLIVKAYLFFYILLMFNWPFADPRFWVPVIPLIAAVVSQTSFSRNQVVKMFSVFFFLVYTVLGLVSLGYMTYTSFNKKEFSKTQAKGVYRNEYETHFFGRPLSDTATHTDPNLVDFLNKNDK
jgi:4-amino-4-deoxy-L-arabinose transferase-like glycosyltransferase